MDVWRVTCHVGGLVRGVWTKQSAGSASQVPRYTPKSPTVSPYLGLLNRNGTPATNYFGLVRRLNVKRA